MIEVYLVCYIAIIWETLRVFQLALQGGGLAGLGPKLHPFYLFDIRSFLNIRILHYDKLVRLKITINCTGPPY